MVIGGVVDAGGGSDDGGCVCSIGLTGAMISAVLLLNVWIRVYWRGVTD